MKDPCPSETQGCVCVCVSVLRQRKAVEILQKRLFQFFGALPVAHMAIAPWFQSMWTK